MGMSEIENPLLAEQQDIESQVSGRISRVREDYVAVPGSANASQDGLGVAPKRKSNWTAVFAISTCCIAAVLLLSAGVVSFNSSMKDTSSVRKAHPVRDQPQLQVDDGSNGPRLNDDEDFYKASKTAYHFQPQRNWMNDPNAPMYYGGYYHFFFQYNPNAAVWGNISWGHAVSTNLVDWMFLEVALYPDKWYDIDGVWSGSGTILKDGTPAMLYTGGRTDANGVTIQSQALALPVDPTDPMLRKWYKVDSNPIMEPPAGYKTDDFRDPTTAWLENDGLWRLLIGTKLDNADGTKDGMALLYKSDDFEKWELEENYLHSVAGSGMWECVDFFPVYVKARSEVDHDHILGAENYLDSYKYVLKASLDTWAGDWYTIGTYSTETHMFTVDDPALELGKGYRYDYGKFYASKTFYDESTGRRILWSWVNESDTEQDDVVKGWASVQAIPRTIYIDPMTQKNLLTWPVKEVEGLREEHVNYKNMILNEGDVIKVEGGDGPQLDIEITFEKPDIQGAENVRAEEFECSQGGSAHTGIFGPFGILVHADDQQFEQTAVYFYIAPEVGGQWSTRMCSDQSKSSLMSNIDKTVYGSYVITLPTENTLSMRVLLDHSVVEAFANGGRMAITSRVYPTIALKDNVRLFLFNNGSTPIKMINMDVYHMADVNIITI